MGKIAAARRALLACCLVTVAAFASAPGTAREGLPDSATGVASSDAARVAAEASNAFAIDLYKQVVTADDNLFFSPASISLAVGFAYRGADGQTASELQQVMHFPYAPAEHLRAAGALDRLTSLAGPGRELRSANALWVRQDIPLRPDYEADIAAQARAGLNRVDFKRDPEAARRDINSWVAGQTADRIDELIAEGMIKRDTGAVLVNAIYWKGDWQAPFSPEATKPETFFRLDGSELQTALMRQGSRFQVLQRRGVKLIDLPYKGGEVSMVVVLPDERDGLLRVEHNLSAPQLADWLEDLDRSEPRDTVLTLPKMSLDWNADLAEVMQAMGAPTPFTDDADFSAMAQLPVQGGDQREIGLKITNVIHQANIDVDENGSEAAAATAVVMGIIVTGSRSPPPPPPFIFTADHPFLLLLRDKRTGLVLFAGRLVDPAQGAAD